MPSDAGDHAKDQHPVLDLLHKTAPLIFWLAMVFAFTLAVMSDPTIVPASANDKINHIIAFAALSILASFAYPKASLIRIFVGLVLFGALIELVQAIPALKRDAELGDLAADAISAAVCLTLVAIFRYIKRLRQTEA